MQEFSAARNVTCSLSKLLVGWVPRDYDHLQIQS